MPSEIRPASLDVVRQLRHAVLRPQQRPRELVFAHDDDPDALHLAAFDDGVAVSIASIAREPPPDDADDASAWRIRGMATLPEHRRRGIGGALLERCVDHARERGGALVWLNGRTPAAAFYERHGFEAVTEVFEVPGIGPHRRFVRSLGYPRPTDDAKGPT